MEAILIAGARVITREGYGRATTKRIAEVAGVSSGTLYQYFPSKEALLTALLLRHSEQMLAVYTEKLASVGGLPLRAAVRELVQADMRARAQSPRLHQVLLVEVPRACIKDCTEATDARIQELLVAHMATRRHELRPASLELAAFILVKAIGSLSEAAALSRPELLGSEEFLGELVDLVLGYLLGAGRGTDA